MIEDLKDLVMVMLDIDIWGGDTALRVNDLSLGAGGHLPPKRAHKLGRKVIIDPRHLKCFDSIKNQAKGICGLYGLEFMGGYAVPVVHQDEAISRLDDLGAKFEEMKNHFLVNYDHFVEEWARQPANRDFADKIRDSKVKPDRVRNSLRFDYRSWEIKPANEKEKAKMEKDITGFVEQILDQVAETVQGFLSTCAKRETSILARSVSPLFGLRNKVDGLKFLGPQFKPIIALFDQALSGLSQSTSGTITGDLFVQLVGTLNVLSSRSQMQKYLDGNINIDLKSNIHMELKSNKVGVIKESQPSLFSSLDLSSVDQRLADYLKKSA